MSSYSDNIENLIQNFYIFGIEPEELEISSIETNYSKKDIVEIKLLSKFPPIQSDNY